MREEKITNFHELHDAFLPYRNSLSWVFRGQEKYDDSYKLKPKAGRGVLNENIDDINFYHAWKRNAASFLSDTHLNEWDWLTIAQHHGLATRFLDWTLNPLIAAYFAIQDAKPNTDPVIIAYHDRKAEDAALAAREGNEDPFHKRFIKSVRKVRPRCITPRIERQQGIFTLHSPPSLCLEETIDQESGRKLEEIVIDKSYIEELRMDLSRYGVNRSTLFPGLDGLSHHMNWWYHPETDSIIT